MTICVVITSHRCQTMFVCPSPTVLDKTVIEFLKLLECYLKDGSIGLHLLVHKNTWNQSIFTFDQVVAVSSVFQSNL